MNFSDMLKRPVVVGVLALVLGLILGLFLAWVPFPTTFDNAPVNLLREDLQKDYLRMSIDSYRVNGDENLAAGRYTQIGKDAYKWLQEIKANPGTLDPNFLAQYEQMLTRLNVLNASGVTPVEPTTVTGPNYAAMIGIVFGGLLAVGVIAGGFYLLRGGRRTGQITPAQHAADIARATEMTDYVAMGEAPPVAHYVTTYVIGDDLFDDSFSIDSPSGEFLGECGVGISETIGVGDPKKVTAFEVWMFDKNDIQTVTKVLMSPHAFNDAGFRSKLEAKGELVAIEPQKQIVLETQTLQMRATVSDMQYGQGTLPDGSYFDRITLELAIWSKK
jgi:hypothetical protein